MSKYTIGVDLAADFDPSVFTTTNGVSQHIVGCDCHDRQQQFVMDVTRMQQQMDSEMRRLMGVSDEMVNQPATLKLEEFMAKCKEMKAIHDQEMLELREAAKAAIDETIKKHGNRVLLMQAPRIASDSIMDMRWNFMMEKAIEQELEARRKILFQRAAENHNQENEDE